MHGLPKTIAINDDMNPSMLHSQDAFTEIHRTLTEHHEPLTVEKHGSGHTAPFVTNSPSMGGFTLKKFGLHVAKHTREIACNGVLYRKRRTHGRAKMPAREICNH